MITHTLVLDRTPITRNGEGETVELPLGSSHVLFTLGIADAVEQESLDLLVKGSADGDTWNSQPLLSFPQKFYNGTSALVLDRERSPEIRFIRASWKVNRWGRGSREPSFTIWLTAEAIDL